MLQSLCEADGEDVAVAKSDQCYSRVQDSLGRAHTHQHHRAANHSRRDSKKHFLGHFAQDSGPAETAYSTEDEIERGGKSGLGEGHTQPFHQNLGRGGVGADIDPHMAHDAQETKENKGVAQQPKTLHKAAALGDRFLVNSGQRECDDGNHADDTVDREQHFPSQPERGDDSRCAPHGDIRCQKRGDSLNELSKRQRGRQVARDDVANQRIK